MGIDLGKTLSKPIELLQENYNLFIPALLPFVISLISGILVGGAILGMGMMGRGGFGTLLGLAGTLGLISFIASLIAEGAIVDMIYKQLKGEPPGYMEGINAALEKLGNLIVAAIIIAIGAFIGFILLVIPGLIWLILVAFTIPIIMLEDLDGVSAIKESISLVKENLGDVVVFLIVLIIVVAVISAVLGIIPYIGSAIATLITTPYMAAALTLAYLQLKGEEIE
ncbi:MAG: hypothetical protein H0Z18_00290 [Thermococcus sp.]|uniref:hypothetical protein n=1 Tax=Thermococcus sp. TaxID=35749 RepID=UPI001D88B8B3|nr:hypothetical protein [Thermococcus sp.]MBO8173673.1 hypothetical protein [Thermococcus sp.]